MVSQTIRVRQDPATKKFRAELYQDGESTPLAATLSTFSERNDALEYMRGLFPGAIVAEDELPAE